MDDQKAKTQDVWKVVRGVFAYLHRPQPSIRISSLQRKGVTKLHTAPTEADSHILAGNNRPDCRTTHNLSNTFQTCYPYN